MVAIWGNISSPYFTGEVGDWADFEGEWKRYVRMLEDGTGKVLGSDIKLELFSKVLDPENKQILLAKRAREETFDEIWDDFEKRYIRDSTEYHRGHWQTLALPSDGWNEDNIRWFKSGFTRPTFRE